MIKKADIILTLSVVLIFGIIVAVFFNFGRGGKYAVVTQEGEEIARYPRDFDTEEVIFHEELGYYNIIEIKGGTVKVKDADCTDGICVKHAPISKAGETIVCLPHQLTVEVEE